MCAAGESGTCGVQYVSCQADCPVSAGNHTLVTRGPFWRSNGTCAPYFACDVGYYQLFTANGRVSCAGCTNERPGNTIWMTPGLSFNDGASCLWECDPAIALASGSGCALVANDTHAARATNQAGFYSLPAPTTCPPFTTSQAGTALYASQCVACPPLSIVQVPTGQGCAWWCLMPSMLQLGAACVLMPTRCILQGFSVDASSGACAVTPIPWQHAGWERVGVEVQPGVPSVIDPFATPSWVAAGGFVMTARASAYGLNNYAGWAERNQEVLKVIIFRQFEALNGLSKAPLTIDLDTVFVAVSLLSGVSNRHWITPLSGTGPMWQAPGPVCSLAVGMIGSSPYAFCAICNQSFLVWVGLGSTNASGLLIGSAVPGWADGFRTQAQFQTELYVAFSAATGTLFVLDRWNCLVREVTIPAVGSYLTQSYTVSGLTVKFGITGEARCYGAGSLAHPRRFFPGSSRAGEVWFYTDDTGIWQLDALYRNTTLVTAWPDTDGLAWVDSPNNFSLWLARPAGSGKVSTQALVAQAVPCPDDTTSLDGGECSVPCAFAGGHYVPVDPSSGACVACLNTQPCPLNKTLVPCNRTAQAYCTACPPPPSGYVYITAGSCDEGSVRPSPPCRPGYYQSQWYCELCQRYSATLYAGAVQVQQCKCIAGFVRSGGLCSAPLLYAFPVNQTCATQPCAVPPNASITDSRLCVWACSSGYYNVSSAGFRDACQPCTNIPPGRRAITNGDTESPQSCEFA